MVRDGWMRRDQSDECTWHGVVCDHNVRGGVVTLIDMSGNNLRGTIPPEITLLKNIGELSLMLVDLMWLDVLIGLTVRHQYWFKNTCPSQRI